MVFPAALTFAGACFAVRLEPWIASAEASFGPGRAPVVPAPHPRSSPYAVQNLALGVSAAPAGIVATPTATSASTAADRIRSLTMVQSLSNRAAIVDLEASARPAGTLTSARTHAVRRVVRDVRTQRLRVVLERARAREILILDVSPLTTTPRYFVMLFNADFTLPGDFAAFLKPRRAFLASALVGVELFPVSPMLATALAEPGVGRRDRRVPWSRRGPRAPRRQALRPGGFVGETCQSLSMDARARKAMLPSYRDDPVTHLVPGGVDEPDARPAPSASGLRPVHEPRLFSMVIVPIVVAVPFGGATWMR